MRLIAVLLSCLSGPATAWDFSPIPICTLSHQGAEMAVRVTFDPDSGEYAIHLTRAEGWPAAEVFSIRFEGPEMLTISTTRHSIDPDDSRVLSVRDRGFGNVLTGLAMNTRAVAILGDLEVPVSLDGAAIGVEAFRACPADQLATLDLGGTIHEPVGTAAASAIARSWDSPFNFIARFARLG